MQAQSEETKPVADENGSGVADAAGQAVGELPPAPSLPPPELVDAAGTAEEDPVAAPEPAGAEAGPGPSSSEGPSDAAAAPLEPPGAGASETVVEPADPVASVSPTPQETPELADARPAERGSGDPAPAGAQSGPEAGLAAAPAPAVAVARPPVPAAPPSPSGPSTIPGLPDLAGPEEDLLDDIPDFEDPEMLPDIPADAGPVVRAGARCKGTVVAVRDSGVIVAFGTKVEGSVPLAEFRQADGTVSVEPGQEIEVLVERMGAPGEYAALSFKRVRELEVWARIQQAHAHNLSIRGTVVGLVKGGLRVDIGVPAFMPGSQIEIRPVRKMDSWVGS